MADHRAGSSSTAIGDFSIVDLIGAGGFADVYRVTRGTLGSTMALKRWRHAVGPDLLRKFSDECSLQFALSDHPNIVRLYYWSEPHPETTPWLVSELYECSLADRLADGPVPIDEAALLADDVLAGLTEIHAHDHVHRDIKPENILLKNGRAAITDMGIAMRLGAVTSSSAAGTFPFVAPELAHGDLPSFRSDVYSAAITLAQLFGPEPPRRVGNVLTRAQSEHPEDRPADIADFRSRLAAAVADTAAQDTPSTHPQTPQTADGQRTDPAPDQDLPHLDADRAAGIRRHRGRKRALLAAAAVVALVAAGITAFALRPDGGSAPNAQVHITSPEPNARVHRCQLIRGTATLPRGDTVVTAFRTTSAPRQWYVEPTTVSVHRQQVVFTGPQYLDNGATNPEIIDIAAWVMAKAEVARRSVRGDWVRPGPPTVPAQTPTAIRVTRVTSAPYDQPSPTGLCRRFFG